MLGDYQECVTCNVMSNNSMYMSCDRLQNPNARLFCIFTETKVRLAFLLNRKCRFMKRFYFNEKWRCVFSVFPIFFQQIKNETKVKIMTTLHDVVLFNNPYLTSISIWQKGTDFQLVLFGPSANTLNSLKVMLKIKVVSFPRLGLYPVQLP